MKRILFLLWVLSNSCAYSQSSKIFPTKEVQRIESTLASDEMRGRKAGTPDIDRAAAFIAAEFKKAGLQPLYGNDFLQRFSMVRPRLVSASLLIDGQPVDSQRVIAITPLAELDVDARSGYEIAHIAKGENLRNRVRSIIATEKNTIVLVDTSFAAQFPRLNSFSRLLFRQGGSKATSVILLLGDLNLQRFDLRVRNRITDVPLANVAGMIPGKGKKQEYVVFSAHYDHLGVTAAPEAGDSIYNGANDDASGTTAVIELANYFHRQGNNQRTLIFVAFTAEEIGSLGSQYFSRQLDPAKVAAMFNIEMIGTESKWGKNSAYITGFEKSDMGAILQKNLKGSAFSFYPDPYTSEGLFYRSDNATLARQGVPAHTISTSKMDNEPNYHKLSDEVGTLDLDNMSAIIEAIATSSASIISGADTPSRVATENL